MKTQGRLPRFEKEPMKTQLTTLHKASRTRELTEPVSGRKPVLALLMRLLWAAVLALPVFGAQAAVVFSSLYSFTGGNDGSYPQSALVQGSDNNFYGTTYGGGTGGYGWQGNGTVFKISTNGALTTLHSFTGTNDGARLPLGWCWAATAISMARQEAVAPTALAPCSKSLPMGR
jgi:uncharacterized repeat protein (TIGR03803 family)